jgi:hypothetical protein
MLSALMKTGYSMTIRWGRIAPGEPYHFIVHNRRDVILARNWRAYKAFFVTRMRVLASADRLRDAAALAAQ